MSDFYNLFELAQLRAISNAIEPTIESIWAMKCREYSQAFYTPLHVVVNELDPMFVLQSLYETHYTPASVDEELEEILEKLYKIENPLYEKISKEEMENLVDQVLNKELKRLGKKKEISKKIELPKKEVEQPKSGFMKFDELEKQESQDELGKKNF